MNKKNKLYIFFRNLSDEHRLVLCSLFGLEVGLLLDSKLEWQHSFLIGWIVAVGSYLIMVAIYLLTDLDAIELKRRFAQTEPNQFKLITVLAIILLFSNIFVGILLGQPKQHEPGEYSSLLLLSVLAILLSWFLLHSSFAIHYARLYYDNDDEYGRPFPGGMRAGLEFPDTDHPTYLDFFYFAFTIALTYAVSDVDVKRSDMRRVILIHSLFSFIFYSTVVTILLNTIVSI